MCIKSQISNNRASCSTQSSCNLPSIEGFLSSDPAEDQDHVDMTCEANVQSHLMPEIQSTLIILIHHANRVLVGIVIEYVSVRIL